jgi:hypothetical protein
VRLRGSLSTLGLDLRGDERSWAAFSGCGRYRCCVGYARRAQGAVVTVNVLAFRATDKRLLRRVDDPAARST